MVDYNPRDWFGLIFKFHRSDTFSKLFWVILSVSVYALIIVYIELELLKMNFSSSVMHSLLGFVISLLLVFRTNTAYDRWWEGRKQWGALVNVTRNFALKVSTYIKDQDRTSDLIHLARMYPYILKEHLRKADYTLLEEDILTQIPKAHLKASHVPNALAGAMQKKLEESANQLSQSSHLALIEDLNRFTDICGACERIRKTPIPYNYNIFIKKFIFVYIITMPIGFAGEFQYWTILISAFVFYTLASLELIAESIEDPFGNDPDDLPTDALARTIDGNLKEIETRKKG